MSLTDSKQILKYNLINIYNTNDTYDYITFYRKLIVYNDKIRLYTNDDLYNKYIVELYNLIDEYMYGNEDDNKLIIIAKNKCCIVLRKIIKYIK
jgi:hypothetical protein